LGGGALAVVPIPSRRASRRRRGTSLAGDLAAGAVIGLRAGGLAARPVDLLRRSPGSRDQVGLGARQRASNREAATEVAVGALRRAEQRGAGAVVLVDDILTTGASILDAERVLARRGCAVLGAMVLAATPATDAASRPALAPP
jgi:predicted amidophosphoribosyltransferase